MPLSSIRARVSTGCEVDTQLPFTVSYVLSGFPFLLSLVRTPLPGLFTAHPPRFFAVIRLHACICSPMLYIQISTHLSLPFQEPPLPEGVVHDRLFFWACFPARLPKYSGIAKRVHGHTRGVIASPGSLLLHTYFQLRYLIYRIATSTHSISPLTRPRSTLAERSLFFLSGLSS